MILHLFGRVLDTVSSTIGNFRPGLQGWPGADNIQKVSDMFRSVEGFILGCPPVRSRFATREDALPAWLYALFHSENDEERLSNHQDYQALMDCSVSELDLIKDLNKDADGGSKMETFALFAPMQIVNMVPFATTSGFMATADSPNSKLQTGDVVCIFHDGPVPFILRPRGEYYQFLGACYIYGMMGQEEQEEFLSSGDTVSFRLV
jgi:hypothetical protein